MTTKKEKGIEYTITWLQLIQQEPCLASLNIIFYAREFLGGMADSQARGGSTQDEPWNILLSWKAKKLPKNQRLYEKETKGNMKELPLAKE